MVWNDVFAFALALIACISIVGSAKPTVDCWLSGSNTYVDFCITIIDCINEFYYYIDASYVVIPYVGILVIMIHIALVIVISL